MVLAGDLTDDKFFNSLSEAIQKAFDKAAAHIHKQHGYKPEMLTDAPVADLIGATATAYQEPLRQIGLKREVPPELTAALEQNTFVFSGFKTHHELTEASALLKDANGGFKPFNQFLNDVQTLNETYNRNYLRAEYNFATASTKMAVKWKDWEADGDDYNLQYRTAADDRVREEHAALNGVTLPPSDKFWNHYLPPNGWNCRCTAVQVLKDKYPESDSDKACAAADGIADTPKKQIFKFNPGKQMKVFPPKHPYLPKGCGDCNRTLLAYNANSEQCRACKAIAKCLNKFGDKETIKQRRNEIRKAAKHFIDKDFENKDFERRTTISGVSLKEMLNQPHKHYNEKNEAILHLDSLYKNATYLGELTKKSDVNYDSYLFETEIAGEKSWIVVKQNFNVRHCVIYSISDSEELVNFLKKKDT